MFDKLCLILVCLSVATSFDGDETTPGADTEIILDAKEPRQLIDRSGWIPQNEEFNGVVIKRRRLRKRKRRPPIATEQLDESENRNAYQQPIRRRFRPTRLDEMDERWEEMADESPKRPAIRRRIIPAYNEEQSVQEKSYVNKPLSTMIQFEGETERPEKIRDPFTALQEAEEKQRNTLEETTQRQTSTTSDLKALLKQSGSGISLSEILQKKNLSLTELLKGNAKAISALTEKPEVQETMMPEVPKYQRQPPSIGLKKNKIQEPEPEETKINVEAQRKRLSMLYNRKHNKIYSEVTQVDVVTEPITEKRIFVPSHPKHYSSVSYKSNFLQDGKISMTSTAIIHTTTEIPSTSPTIKHLIKKLPMTSAQMHFKITTPKIIITTTTSPPMSEEDEGPLQVPIDLTNGKQSMVEEEVPVEKLKVITAKEEIMEMLKDPKHRLKLSTILAGRNMTIEELVEQRERGSSQRHLADIFHNNTREPEPLDEPHVGVIETKYIRNSKSRKLVESYISTSSESPKESKPKIEQSPIQDTSQSAEIIEVVTQQNPLMDLNIFQQQPSLIPFWKQFYPDLYAKISNTNAIDRLEDIENKLSEVTHEKLNVELQPNYDLEEEHFLNLSSGVRSALIASFAIIGLSLVMFLAILVIFRWNKNRLNYAGSITGSKLKSPILDMPARSALKTFVCETLGRRNYYKNNLQSMSDAWDTPHKF